MSKHKHASKLKQGRKLPCPGVRHQLKEANVEIKKIERTSIPVTRKDKYKDILEALKKLTVAESLELTTTDEQNPYSVRVSLYRVGREAGIELSITQRTVDGKIKLYLFRKE